MRGERGTLGYVKLEWEAGGREGGKEVKKERRSEGRKDSKERRREYDIKKRRFIERKEETREEVYLKEEKR